MFWGSLSKFHQVKTIVRVKLRVVKELIDRQLRLCVFFLLLQAALIFEWLKFIWETIHIVLYRWTSLVPNFGETAFATIIKFVIDGALTSQLFLQGDHLRKFYRCSWTLETIARLPVDLLLWSRSVIFMPSMSSPDKEPVLNLKRHLVEPVDV